MRARPTYLSALGAVALIFVGSACTSVLGDFDFEGAGGSTSTATTSATAGGGGNGGGGNGGGGNGGGGGEATSCDDVTCDPNATCDDSSGKAVCSCDDGFHGDGATCTDWDECAGENGGNTCQGDTTCTNTPGGYECTCPPGDYEYPQGSGACVPDPCQPNPCNPAGGTCENGTGVAVCACDPGWLSDTCDVCVRFVDGAASGAKNGYSWVDAFDDVQSGIDAASGAVSGGASSCEVWVKEGTYYVYETVNSTIQLANNVGLYGGFAGNESDRLDADPTLNVTILSGKKSAAGSVRVYHVVTFPGVSGAVVDGLTIQEGDASADPNDPIGGGVRVGVFGATTNAVISRCVVRDNSAKFGGGLSWGAAAGAVTVDGCTFEANTATESGGGISCSDGCVVTDTVFRGNSALNGGGGSIGGVVTLTDCTFVDNRSGVDGAGIRALNLAANAVLARLRFVDNAASGAGGGIYTNGGISLLENGLFLGNLAANGGAIADDSPNGFTCSSCTLAGNRATVNGHAMIAFNNTSGGAPELANSIVWGNPNLTTPSDLDVYPPNWASVGASHSDIGGYAGSDASSFDADPLFTSMPLFFDWTLDVGTTTSVPITAGADYQMGQVLEIGADGVARTVTNINGNTLSFSPALAAAPAKQTQIRNWGGALGTIDAHLQVGSPCINAGTSVGAPTMDIDGNPRVGNPDLGVYEAP